ncbi:MAG: hypothetical protein IJC50_07610 [Clostridia bacterium]|nr:hypothetical protein [Clostridia bacterium]
MRKIMILNPAAGHGDADKLSSPDGNISVYKTKCIGDAERYVAEECRKDPETHFIVCGGDGTVNEVVNGIMNANAGDTAMFSIVPTGTGNDFIKNGLEKHKCHKVDVISINGKYAVNMINIGFDCDVVEKTQFYKQKHSGSTAYLMGVGNVLFHKMGQFFRITYTDTDDQSKSIEQECLLCAVANGAYAGGGFNFAPNSAVNDGVLDVLIVDKISRIKFLSLIGNFRAGKFISPEGVLKKGFDNAMKYIKCTSIKVENTRTVCIDGEVAEADFADITVLPKAINYYA